MEFRRNETKRYLALAGALAFLLLVPVVSTSEDTRTGAALNVVFTGDVNGYIEPCG